MGATERERAGPSVVRCARCGEVIGVYEPLVHVLDGIADTTSRAASPEIAHTRGAVYHAACHGLDGTSET